MTWRLGILLGLVILAVAATVSVARADGPAEATPTPTVPPTPSPTPTGGGRWWGAGVGPMSIPTERPGVTPRATPPPEPTPFCDESFGCHIVCGPEYCEPGGGGGWPPPPGWPTPTPTPWADYGLMGYKITGGLGPNSTVRCFPAYDDIFSRPLAPGLVAICDHDQTRNREPVVKGAEYNFWFLTKNFSAQVTDVNPGVQRVYDFVFAVLYGTQGFSDSDDRLNWIADTGECLAPPADYCLEDRSGDPSGTWGGHLFLEADIPPTLELIYSLNDGPRGRAKSTGWTTVSEQGRWYIYLQQFTVEYSDGTTQTVGTGDLPLWPPPERPGWPPGEPSEGCSEEDLREYEERTGQICCHCEWDIIVVHPVPTETRCLGVGPIDVNWIVDIVEVIAKFFGVDIWAEGRPDVSIPRFEICFIPVLIRFFQHEATRYLQWMMVALVVFMVILVFNWFFRR